MEITTKELEPVTLAEVLELVLSSKILTDEQATDVCLEAYRTTGYHSDDLGVLEFKGDCEVFNQLFETPEDAICAVHFGKLSFNDEFIRLDAYGHVETLSETEFQRECAECHAYDLANDPDELEAIADNLNLEIDDDQIYELEQYLHYDRYFSEELIDSVIELIRDNWY